jgi:hypothetical protein
VFLGVEIGLDDVADEIAPCFCRYRFCGHSEFLSGIGAPCAKFAPMSQAYFAHGRGFSYAPFLLYHRQIHPQPAR